MAATLGSLDLVSGDRAGRLAPCWTLFTAGEVKFMPLAPALSLAAGEIVISPEQIANICKKRGMIKDCAQRTLNKP